jgi:tetratricopeptide (TPR) repeat protein
LQTIAEPNTIVVSALTRQLAAEGFAYRDLGAQDLKGFDKPIQAYQVLSERSVTRLEARSASLTPFVGRHREVATLCERWERVLSGHGQVVAIVGEAGVGKSRVAAEARLRIAALQLERGLTAPSTLVFQCSAHHTNAPLYPIVRGLEEAAAIRQLGTNTERIDRLEACLDRRHTEFNRYLSVLVDLLGLKADERYPPLSITPAEKRRLTIEALSFWCASLCAGRSLLIVFEDVQWIDPTSKLFLSRLSRWAKDNPALIVATLRSDDAPDFDALVQVGLIESRGERPPHVIVCEMQQLGAAETRTLIAASAADKSIAAGEVEAISKSAGGNPLYVEELTREIVAASLAADTSGRSGQAPALKVPSTIADALMSRLDRLGPAKETAQQAAVIGQEFSLLLLARIASKSLEEASVDAEALLASGLVVRNHSIPHLYRFKHTLIRDVAYEALLRKGRREIHLRIAAELGNAGDDHLYANDVVARHYSLGGSPEKSVALWQKAAKEAIARSAHEEALAMLESALEDFEKLGAYAPANMEIDLVLAKATALRSMRGYSAPAVVQALTRARDLCEVSQDIDNRFNVDWCLFQGNVVRGDLHAARELADQLLAHSDRHPSLPRVDALLAAGMSAFHVGNFEQARDNFETGVALVHPETDDPHFFTHGQNPGVFCLSYLAHAQCFLGQLDRARDTIERNVAISALRARNPAHLHSHINALTFAVRVHEFCGDTDMEKQRASQILEISRRNGYKYYEAVSTCHMAWTAGVGGSLAEGIAGMLDGIAALERTGTALSLPRFFVLLAELHMRAGQFDEASQAIDKALASERLRTRAWDAEIERVRGEIFATKPAPDLASAKSAYQASLAIAQSQQARMLELKTTVSLARLLQKTGSSAEACRLLGNCLQQISEGLDTLPVRSAQAMLQSLHGPESVGSKAMPL